MLVQAHGAYGSDNTYVLDALPARPGRVVGVVIVDPADPDPAAHAARARAGARDVTGVRLFGIGPTAPAWFDGDAGAALWDAAVELDLRIVATLLAPDLPRLVDDAGAVTRTCRSCSTTAVSPTCATARRSRARRRCSRWPTIRRCT